MEAVSSETERGNESEIPANHSLQRTGGTAVVCGEVARAELCDVSAPAAEAWPFGVPQRGTGERDDNKEKRMSEHGAQYDHIGSKYDEYAQTATLKRAESYTVLRMVGPLAGKRVLDLACGFGFYTRLLKQHGAAQVMGIDISPEMVRLGRGQGAGGAARRYLPSIRCHSPSCAGHL